MKYRILGGVEAVEGERVSFDGAGKPAAVLAILLLHRNEVVSVEALVERLWAGQPPRTAVKSLQTYVSQLRRALGDEVIATHGRAYLLSVAHDGYDAGQFEALLVSSRAALHRGDASAAATSVRDALQLWRGPPFGQLRYEPWAEGEVRRLEELRLQALEIKFEADLALGRHAEVVAELERVRRDEPLRERLLALQMIALYRCGRQADALAAFRGGRTLLNDELGIEPSPDLRLLEQQILQHDPALGSVSQRPTLARALATPVRRGVLLAAAVLALAGVAWTFWPTSPSDAVGLVAANSALEIRANGRTGTAIGVGAEPGYAAFGGGYLWTSNDRDGTVSRVDDADRSTQAVSVGHAPQGIAYVDGDVWVANGGDASVTEVDPRSGTAIGAVHVGNGPTAVAGRGHLLWVANSVDGSLTTIDTRVGKAVGTVPVGPQPDAVAVATGAVWVALAGSGSVAQLDRAGRSVLGVVGVGGDPVALSVTPGSVWVANRQDGTVTRIDSASARVTATLAVGGPPVSLAADGRRLWIALATGRLVWIDLPNGRLEGGTRLPGTPSAVVAAEGRRWVTVTAPPASHRGGTLRVAVTELEDCACLDPVRQATLEDWQLSDLVYDGLVAYRRVSGPSGSSLVGDLARSVPQPGAGGRVYVFRLRRGVAFSDGRPVRASDVRASIVRALTIIRVSSYAFPLQTEIVGAQGCGTGGRCNPGRGIFADNAAGTVTFRLRAPDPDFLYKLALPWAFVVPADTPRASSRRFLAGTGPYRIVSETKDRLVLGRNSGFRLFAPDATPAGYPDQIRASALGSAAREVAAVNRGAVDVTGPLWNLPEKAIARLGVAQPSQLHTESRGEVDYMFLNTRVFPFNRMAGRRALNEAADRELLVRLAGGPNAATATCQVLPADLPGYKPYCPYGLHRSAAGTWSGPNLALAHRLVGRSGTRGASVKVWTLRDHEAIGTYFAGLLRRLGYRATTRVVDDSHRYYELVGNPRTRAQIGWFGWIKDYTTPSDFIPPLFGCKGIVARDPAATTNYSMLCDQALDQKMVAAGIVQQQDPVQGQNAWASVDRRIVDLGAAVPYADDVNPTLVSQRVRNYEFNPEWGVLLDQLWVR